MKVRYIAAFAFAAIAAIGPAAPALAAAEPYEITVAFFTPGIGLKDLPAVQDEINKIVEPKIGARVKLLPIAIGSWQQQVNLMMASDEKLDLVVTGTIPFLGFGTYAVRNQIIPMDELLAKYGAGIKASMAPEFYNVGKIGGKIYGVPSVRDFATQPCVYLRRDVLDELKIDPKAIKSYEDLAKALKVVKDKKPGMSPIMQGGSGASGGMLYFMSTWDYLGDNMGVLMDNGKALKVVNLFEQAEYAKLAKMVHAWYEEGLVMQDAATVKDQWQSFVKAGKLFSVTGFAKPGIEAQVSGEAGQAMAVVPLKPAYSTTSTVTTILWSIARNSKNPEKAMQFLNLMYSDPAVINLLDWGIEGRHYAKQADGSIDFPAGVNWDNVGYGPHLGFEFGNQLLSYIWKGDSLSLYKDMAVFNNGALKSKALGFIFDPSAVKTEYAAVSNVLNQYQLGIEVGMLDPDKVLLDFNKKLKAAGLDKVMAEKQRQLDAWAKANGVK